MQYYSRLLLPQKWSAAARLERLQQVLAAMGLSHVEGTLVGGYLPGGIELRGVSGGEDKRLSVATGGCSWGWGGQGLQSWGAIHTCGCGLVKASPV